MSLNQAVAALAVTEFKALVTGLREPVRQILYDLLTAKVMPGVFSTGKGCVVCQQYVGLGDLLEIERRYAGLNSSILKSQRR